MLVLFYPGISSGVLCVVFGIYESLIQSILNIFKDFKKNFLFLLPISIGAFFGIVIFGKILKLLFNTYYIQTCYLFIGLILGSIPSVYKQIQTNNKLNILSIICLLLSLSASIYLVAIEQIIIPADFNNPTFLHLLIAGIFMSAGIVIPGVSSTVILMLFGIYELYLSAISTLNFMVLFPLGLGTLFGGFIFLIIIQFFIKHYKTYTYFRYSWFCCWFYICSISRFFF